jgi:hypothetical protein
MGSFRFFGPTDVKIALICMYFTQNGNSKVFQKVYQYKVKHQIQHLFNSPPQYKGILQDQLYSLTAQ